MSDAEESRMEGAPEQRESLRPPARRNTAASKRTLSSSRKPKQSGRHEIGITGTGIGDPGRILMPSDPDYYLGIANLIRRTGDDSIAERVGADPERLRAATQQLAGADDNELPVAIHD